MNAYEKYLHDVVDTLFDEAAKHYTWPEFAKEAGVCYGTVYRLGMRYTKLPQLRTIFLLAKAVGMDVAVIKRRARALRAA